MYVYDMNMSLPISRFFIPTKQGKIYAGILAVIVILVSWIMTVNSLIYIDHYPCYEDAICMRPTVVPVRERGTDYSTLFWGLFVGSFFILLILFSKERLEEWFETKIASIRIILLVFIFCFSVVFYLSFVFCNIFWIRNEVHAIICAEHFYRFFNRSYFSNGYWISNT